MTATATKQKGGVEFNCLGGSVVLRHGYKEDENGDKKKLYFSRADIEKLKLPDTFLAKRSDGREIGLIELDMNKTRKIIVPYYEEEMIELLKSNELVSKAKGSQKLTNKVSWFDPQENKLERQKSVQGRQLALLVVAGLPKADLKDLSICLGMREVDTISDPDFADIIDNKPQRILDMLDVKQKDGVPKGTLYESFRVEAILRRAINVRVVKERAGALFFAEEQIGTDFRNALKNLQNKTKGDDASMAHVLPLIKAKLEGKDDE